MAGSQYLVRFDDICPTMNWAVWEAIERELDACGVKPILAVVPDNRDPKLEVDPPRADFWDRVRTWQAKGYTIALHGYQHRYVNRNPGLMGLTRQSEFAGLPRAEQKAKLESALAIFADEKVRIDAWVAPSHSFDRATVALLAELGVTTISDGLWPKPFEDKDGVRWIPQQLWGFREKGDGVWTVCNHHNGWSEPRLAAFGEALRAYAPRMTDVPSVLRSCAGRRLSLSDRWKGFTEFIWTHRIVGPIWDARRRMRERRAMAG